MATLLFHAAGVLGLAGAKPPPADTTYPLAGFTSLEGYLFSKNVRIDQTDGDWWPDNRKGSRSDRRTAHGLRDLIRSQG